MVQEPSHAKQLSLIHMCKIGLRLVRWSNGFKDHKKKEYQKLEKNGSHQIPLLLQKTNFFSWLLSLMAHSTLLFEFIIFLFWSFIQYPINSISPAIIRASWKISSSLWLNQKEPFQQPGAPATYLHHIFSSELIYESLTYAMDLHCKA